MNAQSKRVRWLPAGAALVLAMTWIVSTDVRPAEADPLLDREFSAFTRCAYTCRQCGTENDPRHEIIQSVSNNASSSHLENCQQGDCSGHSCKNVIEPASLGELWVAVREAEGEELEAALERYGEYAYYNADRDAVQVRGCEGTVLASIPLSDAQVAVLEE